MRIPRLSAERGSLLFALGSALLACGLPLTSTFGPESSLLFALTLSPWACALAARRAHAARTTETATLLAGALGANFRMLALSSLVLALNGLRQNACDPSAGLRFLALGPAPALALATLVGLAVGSSVRSLRGATTLAALLPLLEVARASVDFVRTPAIYAFGHFFGYFPGTFYDRRVEVPDAWLSHRLLTALIAGALWAWLAAARDPSTGRLARARLPGELALLSLASALSLACALGAHRAHALHHRTSSAAITEQLGLVIQAGRCRAVMPRETPPGDAHRLAEDCAFRIDQLEQLLGVREDASLTAFFFRSPQEKRTWMGAARVYIAKPWRREVYLQLAEYPHPILPHELAHVVARHASSGLFGVPGRLFGLIPEPTLVEGMAVALEPHARDELTPHQWAKAAYQAKSAPPLSELLGVKFFGTNQALAYTLAGSFLRFILESRGAAELRRIYAQGSVESALGAPLPELERAYRAFLASVPLPERAAALAQQRFDRPSVFGQVCPHLVEQLGSELGAALSAGDAARALAKCREVLRVDAHDGETRATLVGILARTGEEPAAEAELKRLTGPPSAPRPTLARAQVALADARFARGELAQAAADYRKLLAEPQPEGELRQLEVKALAVAAPEPGRSLLRELLVGDGLRSTEPRAALHLIRDLREVREDGLALYLEARQLSSAGRHDLAHRLLREALARGLPTARLRVEALRMHALSAFVMGALAEAEAVASELERREGASPSEQLEAQDWLARIAYRRAHARR